MASDTKIGADLTQSAERGSWRYDANKKVIILKNTLTIDLSGRNTNTSGNPNARNDLIALIQQRNIENSIIDLTLIIQKYLERLWHDAPEIPEFLQELGLQALNKRRNHPTRTGNADRNVCHIKYYGDSNSFCFHNQQTQEEIWFDEEDYPLSYPKLLIALLSKERIPADQLEKCIKTLIEIANIIGSENLEKSQKSFPSKVWQAFKRHQNSTIDCATLEKQKPNQHINLVENATRSFFQKTVKTGIFTNTEPSMPVKKRPILQMTTSTAALLTYSI